MEWFTKNNRQKLLLGQLLVEENLLSANQLARAIERQQKTGQLLGDVVAELELISRKQIATVLRRQRTMRFTASIVTVLLTPIPILTATASSPVTITQAHKAAPVYQSQRRVVRDSDLFAPSISGVEVVEFGAQSSLPAWVDTLVQAQD